jgi:hypothetical protein
MNESAKVAIKQEFRDCRLYARGYTSKSRKRDIDAREFYKRRSRELARAYLFLVKFPEAAEILYEHGVDYERDNHYCDDN